MSRVNYYKNIALTLIDNIKQINSLINQNDIDEETKNKLIKKRNESERCLRNTTKTDFLIAGGSLKEFNELVSVLEDKQEDKQEGQKDQAVAQEDNQEVNQEDKDIQDVKNIDINDVYKYNLEMIKRMSFDEFKFNIVLYTDATKLREEIIKTITAEKIDMRIIEYYYEKIELLKQNHCIIRDNKQRYSITDKLMRLKLTLDTVKDLEALRMCLKIYN